MNIRQIQQAIERGNKLFGNRKQKEKKRMEKINSKRMKDNN